MDITDIPEVTDAPKAIPVNPKEQEAMLRRSKEQLAAEIRRVEETRTQRLNALQKKQSGLFSVFNDESTIKHMENEVQQVTLYLNYLKKQDTADKPGGNLIFNEDLVMQYKKVVDAFDLLLNTDKIWNILPENEALGLSFIGKGNMRRIEVKFSKRIIDFINVGFPGLLIQNGIGGWICLYPGFIVSADKLNQYTFNDIGTLGFSYMSGRYSAETLASDAKQIAQTDTSDGVAAAVLYGECKFITARREEMFIISNDSYGETFANELMQYLKLVQVVQKGIVTEGDLLRREEFDRIKEFSDRHTQIYKELQGNPALLRQIYQRQQDKMRELRLDALSFPSTEEMLKWFFRFDLMNSFSLACDISNTKSRAGFAVMYAIRSAINDELTSYAEHPLFWRDAEYVAAYKSQYDTFMELSHSPQNVFTWHLINIFQALDKEMQQRYLTNLYRFVSVMVKFDGTVTATEADGLKQIITYHTAYALGQGGLVDVAEAKTAQPVKEKTLEELLAELNGLTGLMAVKTEIQMLINFIKVQKLREEKGIKASAVSYHLVFTGNPGTGKTTVARILAQIYRAIGVVKQGQLVETDRSGLIAGYVGQTALKVNAIVNDALNGVLFIDEAYALVNDEQDSFGEEAVAILLKRMEDNRDKLAVILAGYTGKMQAFIATNPGFKSRFNRFIEFPDYTPAELLLIFDGFCRKLDYQLTTDAKEKLASIFDNAYRNRDETFGNARFARNIFEKSMEHQANRIANIGQLTNEILTTITAEDIA